MGNRCCTERKEVKKKKAYTPEELKAFVPGPIPEGIGSIDEIATQFRETLLRNGSCIVCIASGTKLEGQDSGDLVKAVAPRLVSEFGKHAVFVTSGLSGGQEVFAKNCGEDTSQLWNVCPDTTTSGYGVGTDLEAGKDKAENSDIFANIGDIYLTIEGGPRVANEISIAHERGAIILPLIRTGGASSGMFEFPPQALEKLEVATANQWALLGNKEASVEDFVEAVIDIGKGLINVKTEVHEETKAISTKWKSAALHLKMAGAVVGTMKTTTGFSATEALGVASVQEAEDMEMEAIMSTWKPRGNRGRALRSTEDTPVVVDVVEASEEFTAPPPPAINTEVEVVPLRSAATAAPPPPPPPEPLKEEDHLTEATSVLDEIAESRKRMEARLEAKQLQVEKATTSLQAVLRGKMARKAFLRLKASKAAASQEAQA